MRVRVSLRPQPLNNTTMKAIKKIISTILALGCFASMMLASGECTDGSADFLWSMAWVGTACLCGVLFALLNKNFREEGVSHIKD